MELLQIVVLALVQGVTEFLPISSSAHLILVPVLTGWPDQGLGLDVAMHAGTLAAVVTYFHRDTAAMVRGGCDLVRGKAGEDARLALLLLIGTAPVVVAGYLLKESVASDWRNPLLIAATTIGFAFVLWAADRSAGAQKGAEVAAMTLAAAFIIGMAQTVALVPGVSRSGITMTAALLLGYRRTASARFSLLLSIPTTAAAAALTGIDLWQSGDQALQVDALFAAVLSFVAALAAIAFLMRWLRRATFMPFVWYRLGLGLALLAWIYAVD